MDVLLTGGSGLVGRTILRVLQQQGLQQGTSGPSWRVDAPSSGDLDLQSQASVEAWFATRSYDVVIHAAAVVGGINVNKSNPTKFLAGNLLINTLLIEGARRAGVKNLMFVGSANMYPADVYEVLREEHMLTAPLEPLSEGYALAKIAGARLCDTVSKEFNLNYRTIVPCNLYGPDDHFDPDKGHLIAAALFKLHRAKVSGLQSVEIWGDGEARREFLYADDLARFIIEWAPKLSELPNMINVGAGEDLSVNEYYAEAANVVGYTGAFDHLLSAPVGIRRKLLDVSKVSALGWRPRTSLAEGMLISYEAMQSKMRDRVGG